MGLKHSAEALPGPMSPVWIQLTPAKQGTFPGGPHLDELHILGLVTSQMLHALVGHLESIVQVVDDGHPASMIEQAEDSMAACKQDSV